MKQSLSSKDSRSAPPPAQRPEVWHAVSNWRGIARCKDPDEWLISLDGADNVVRLRIPVSAARDLAAAINGYWNSLANDSRCPVSEIAGDSEPRGIDVEKWHGADE